MKKLNRSFVFPVIAIVCFAAAWFIVAGHSLFGTDTEWLFAGLIAFAARSRPRSTAQNRCPHSQ
jgi:hypothetical protein